MSEPQGYKIGKEANRPRIDALIEASRLKRIAKREAAAALALKKAKPGTVPKPVVVHEMTDEARARLRGLANGTVQRSPHTSRARLNGKFVTALAEDFELHGKRTIERMRIHDPSGYIKTVAFLMPKQFEQTTPIQNLTDEELERGIDYLRSRLAVSDGKGIRKAAQLSAPDGVQTLSKTDGIP